MSELLFGLFLPEICNISIDEFPVKQWTKCLWFWIGESVQES